jgi:hypothetical protein
MNEIKLKERTPEQREAYYTRIALENAMQKQEIRKLNGAILRKNFTVARLRQNLKAVNAVNVLLAEKLGAEDETFKAIGQTLEAHFGPTHPSGSYINEQKKEQK